MEETEIGFDNLKYVRIQSEKIKERFKFFDKLYLEIGGKLFDDSHAARILPGFKNDSKISLFLVLKDDLEIIFCISASDIEKNKTRGEYGIPYSQELIKLINCSKKLGLSVNSVVVTLYNNQICADKFIKKLRRNGIKTFIHKFVKGYPTNINIIVSEQGYGANPYIPTTKKLILVNAPGPGSGKLATCLSQIYHESNQNINAGYAKFETFPVWNLPLNHPVNLAYEAATADLKDVNLIDPFHLEKYGINATNYNRDIETFPILRNILDKVQKKTIYYSPTDMGVNMIGFFITNNTIVEEASKREIIRRYYEELNNFKMGLCEEDTYKKIHNLMMKANIDEKMLDVVQSALDKKNKENGAPILAIKIGKEIIFGKESELLTAPGAAILNALKFLSKIPEDIDLISPNILSSILKFKKEINSGKKLLLSEVLTTLSICAVTNPSSAKAINSISQLKNSEAHSTYIISGNDKRALKELKINLSCENEILEEIEL